MCGSWYGWGRGCGYPRYYGGRGWQDCGRGWYGRGGGYWRRGWYY